MLKYLLGFALVFGLAIYVAVQDKHAAQHAAQEAQQPGNAAISAAPNANHPQQNIPYTERNLPSWYSFFRWPNGTTVWAIILTLFAIAEQTRETAKTADASTQAARAALLNAQAVLNAERPWLLIRPIPTASGHQIHFAAKNYGRTPAEIISFFSNWSVADDENDIPQLSQPKFSLGHRVILVPLRDLAPSHQGLPMSEWERTSYGFYDFYIEDVLRTHPDTPAIKLAQKRLGVYGILIYADVLTKSLHHTKFCYWWNPADGGLVIGGPEGANEHT